MPTLTNAHRHIFHKKASIKLEKLNILRVRSPNWSCIFFITKVFFFYFPMNHEMITKITDGCISITHDTNHSEYHWTRGHDITVDQKVMTEWPIYALVNWVVFSSVNDLSSVTARPLSEPVLTFERWSFRNKLQGYLNQSSILVLENAFENSVS